MSRSVMMSDLSWPEYKRRLEEEDAIILLPVGAVEQHGYHLPLGTDWITESFSYASPVRHAPRERALRGGVTT